MVLVHRSPLRVLEDELSELEVPQHDAKLVTGGHRGRYLPEKRPRLRLPQVPLGPDVRVQVPVTTLENHIGASPANYHLFHLVDVRMRLQAKVTVENFAVHFVWHNLQHKKQFSPLFPF